VSGPVASFDEAVLRSFPPTFESLENQGLLTPIATVEALRGALSAGQVVVFDRVMDLDPRDYGVDTPYAGHLEPVPTDLVEVTGQQYTENGERKTIGRKYVPRPVFDAYAPMNEAFAAAHPGRKLLVQSCYRSPAYQVAVFIHWLIHAYQGDIARTVRHASPPTYSQHTIARKAAIDFRNVDGKPSDAHPEDFGDTVEYRWLRQNAGDFRFYESWQEGNEFGMRPEPWHWQYRP
jgi:LAS superfamily LD-carboxypeptidase LdcB